jgi:ferredoxin
MPLASLLCAPVTRRLLRSAAVAQAPRCARQTCTACGASVQQCPFCRADIRTRITLFT